MKAPVTFNSPIASNTSVPGGDWRAANQESQLKLQRRQYRQHMKQGRGQGQVKASRSKQLEEKRRQQRRRSVRSDDGGGWSSAASTGGSPGMVSDSPRVPLVLLRAELKGTIFAFNKLLTPDPYRCA